MRRRRRPILRRDPDPPPLRFSPEGRDGFIVEAVYRYRQLTREQIQRLAFPPASTSYAKQRLMLLFHHRYLDRLAYSQGPYGAPRIVYALAERGADYVAQRLGVERAQLDWRPRDNQIEPYFIAHLLAVNEVRISIEQAARQRGWPLEWLDERDLKRRLDLRGRGAQPVPDGWFRLHDLPVTSAKRRASFALELDRGTMDRRAWKSKVQAYLRWIGSGAYARDLGSRGLRVLVVASHVRRVPLVASRTDLLERRLDTLKRWSEEAGGTRLFWFTHSERLASDDPLVDPLWDVARASALQVLIEPQAPLSTESSPNSPRREPGPAAPLKEETDE